MKPVPDRWQDAVRALHVLAVDPSGLGGIRLRAPAGPVRERWLRGLQSLMQVLALPLRRMPVNVPDGRLLGGLDLTATLRAGRPVAERGLLAQADGGLLLLPMAERLPPETAGRLLAAMDRGEIDVARDGLSLRLAARFGLIALDEGEAEDMPPPAAICDRLAMTLDLTMLTLHDSADVHADDCAVRAAREGLHSVVADDDALAALCATAQALGIVSLRAPWLALRVARAAAAVGGRAAVDDEALGFAGRMVLAPRATQLPAAQDDQADVPPADEDPPQDERADDGADSDSTVTDAPLQDRVLAATQAAIPPGLLALLQAGLAPRARSDRAGRSGALLAARRRGRAIGTRRGELRGGARLDVVETLRAAAPWQPLRRAAGGERDGRPRVEVRADDVRICRLKHRTQTTTLFAVDASGSSALHRLAETKGAVELLLADCYVRRDQVALLAFRGERAELALPPTRSLVRAKRALAGLPGGGATPLAAGIEALLALAEAERRRGHAPVAVLLTDGRGNVARDGTQGRSAGESDALAAARHLRAAGIRCVLIDTSPRPQPAAALLADTLGARYLPLPHADAHAMSAAVRISQR